MPDVTKTIQIVVDATTGKAKAAFSDLKTGVGEADGAFGKLKAGISGAGSVLSSLPIGTVATAAAGAVAGVLALGNEFEQTALQAKKLSDATGLSVEDASRWQEVAGDVGVSAETLAGAFGKATKAIGTTPEKFAELGIEIQRTSTGAVDMNGTLLSAIGTINSISDPTKKAALASQLFGKSWAELTPVLSQGTDQIRQNLAAVSAAKTITEDEVKSAQKWQASMDALGDTLDDLKLTAGKLVVDGFGPTLEALGEMAQTGDDVINTLDELTGPLGSVADGFALWFKYLSPLGFSLKALSVITGEFATVIEAIEGPISTVADGLSKFGGVVGDVAGSVEDFVRGPFGGDSKKLWEEWGVGAEKAGKSTDTFATATDGAKVSAQGFHDVIGAVGVIQTHLLALQDEAQAMKDEKAAADETSKAIDALNKFRDAAIDALNREQDAALAAIDSQVGYDRSIQDVGTALGNFQSSAAAAEDAAKKHGAASDEAAAAQQRMDQSSRGLEDSISRTAAAAVQYATDQANAAGQTLNTEDKINVQIGALEDLKAKYPELGPAIDAHIAKLHDIPTTIRTEADFDASEARKKLEAFISRLLQAKNIWQLITAGGGGGGGDAVPQNAGGGDAPVGQPMVVGDAGRPELFVPRENGTILPYVPTGAVGSGGPSMVNNFTIIGGGPTVAQEVLDGLTWRLRTGQVRVA